MITVDFLVRTIHLVIWHIGVALRHCIQLGNGDATITVYYSMVKFISIIIPGRITYAILKMMSAKSYGNNYCDIVPIGTGYDVRCYAVAVTDSLISQPAVVAIALTDSNRRR